MTSKEKRRTTFKKQLETKLSFKSEKDSFVIGEKALSRNNTKNRDSFNSPVLQSKSPSKLNPINGKKFELNSKIQAEQVLSQLNNHEDVNTEFKDLLEKADISSKVDLFINESLEMLQTNSSVNICQDKEKYELLEKTYLKELKEDIEKLKIEEDALIDQFNKLAEHYNTAYKELYHLNVKYKQQERNKAELTDLIVDLQEENVKIRVRNHKLRSDILKSEIQRDNLIRALVNIKKKYSANLPPALNELYKKYNTKDFLGKYLENTNKTKIRILEDKIKELESNLKGKKDEVVKSDRTADNPKEAKKKTL